MVDDLQALALADAGALNLRKEALDLAELAGQTAESFRNRLAQRKIRLETGLENRVEVSGDPQRLRQLLHNLLENSNRYVESGGTVCLTVEPGEEATLLLEDSGPGVSDEQKDQLFERFYRAEGSRARATGGSGLGLSICKNIAEAHGGRIEAEHSPLGGLLIRVVLPI
jgi:two-component system sensor histidine kinase BaeS